VSGRYDAMATTRRVARVRPPGGLVLALVCCSQFMVILDAAIVNVALPTVQRDLGFTDTGLAWVVNGYLLSFAGFLLVGGRAADRFGHRRMLVVGLLVFSASSLVAGLSIAPGVLVAARLVQGVGAAVLAPATLAVINTGFPGERARALGAWSAAGGVGGMAGALAGGALTTGLSWRWVFLVNVPIGALLIAATMTALMGARAGRREELDVAGAITGTAGLFALVYGITQVAGHGWASPLRCSRVLPPATTWSSSSRPGWPSRWRWAARCCRAPLTACGSTAPQAAAGSRTARRARGPVRGRGRRRWRSPPAARRAPRRRPAPAA
jgi:MFS family permease